MFKQIPLTIFISSISLTSYAYVVESNLTVENHTDVPMVMVVEQPNGQPGKTINIPAHGTTNKEYMQNGDTSGMLYQTSTAPFTIRETDAHGKVYAQGRVAYYVGASLWNKYSFLDAMTSADNIKLDASYTCKNGGYNTTFDNRIVIDGIPGNEMQARNFPTHASCQGLKSSELSDNNQFYNAVCADGKKSVFTRGTYKSCDKFDCWDVTGYSNGGFPYIITYVEDNVALHNQLDRVIGNSYCGNWQV